MNRVLSGIQPSGVPHIGNYFGALRQWVRAQEVKDAYFLIVDLHALTLEISPQELHSRTFDTAISLLGAGLDTSKCTMFVQSHVSEHNELGWLLECVATFGELHRMTQFKDKSADQNSVRVSLFTYPTLMAADILLYQAEEVPVGDDQRQHLELARDLALRFNGRYGEVFQLPKAVVPEIGARIMDLQHPERKMSKSIASPLGTIQITDAADEIAKKVRRAVTDTDAKVLYDPVTKPGVSNLLELLSCSSNRPIEGLAEGLSSYRALKEAVIESLVEELSPVQQRLRHLQDDPVYVRDALRAGAERARSLAGATLESAREALGLLER